MENRPKKHSLYSAWFLFHIIILWQFLRQLTTPQAHSVLHDWATIGSTSAALICYKPESSQETRGPMLGQRRDAAQHWANASCLLGLFMAGQGSSYTIVTKGDKTPSLQDYTTHLKLEIRTTLSSTWDNILNTSQICIHRGSSFFVVYIYRDWYVYVNKT